ncbi:MAG: hypothetical protein JWM59_4276 [Verrucomicrobiales bacterium]|nr:hypothetical protein [Verrucomicrobiales bacterium]
MANGYHDPDRDAQGHMPPGMCPLFFAAPNSSGPPCGACTLLSSPLEPGSLFKKKAATSSVPTDREMADRCPETAGHLKMTTLKTAMRQ